MTIYHKTHIINKAKFICMLFASAVHKICMTEQDQLGRILEIQSWSVFETMFYKPKNIIYLGNRLN